MAKDLNRAQFTGRLGKDPEGRYTTDGAFVCTFSLASNRSWRDSAGTPHEDVEWVRCVAWSKLGEICNQYLTKGARVYVEGRLQTRKWQDQDGQDRWTTEVILSDMIMLDRRRDGREPPDEDAEIDWDEPPQRQPAPAKAAPKKLATPRNVPRPIESDGDIPF